jgi:hypothetical protein
VVESDNESDISDDTVASGYSGVTVSNALPSTSVQDWNSTDIPPILETFLGVPGVTARPSEPENIGGITGLTFGNDFFELLALHTNLYHQQTKALHKPSPKGLKWAEVTTLEVKKFLRLIILMGHVRKLHWKDYRSTDPILETPIFPKTMSRNKFEQILALLHFCDNSKITPGTGRIYKVKPPPGLLIVKISELLQTKKNQVPMQKSR